MRQSEINQILFFGGAALAIGAAVASFLAITRVGHLLRVIRHPSRKLVEATPNTRATFDLTVTGVEGEPAAAPFSLRPCGYCSWTIWERRGRRSRLTHGDRLDRVLLATDANGHVARVATHRAEVYGPLSIVDRGGEGGKAWLRQRGLAQGVIGYTFREQIIAPGSAITVVGDLTAAPNGQREIIPTKTLDTLIVPGTRARFVRGFLAMSIGGVLGLFIGLATMGSVVMKKRPTPATPTTRAPAARPTTPAPRTTPAKTAAPPPTTRQRTPR